MHSLTALALPLAQAAPGGAPQQQGGGSLISMLIMFVPIVLIMYFFMIRPQQRRQKDHDAMVKSLQAGDKVVTTGGLIGTVTKADDEKTVRLRIATGVEVTLLRGYVAGKTEGDTP